MHTDEYVDLITSLDDADLARAEDAKWQLIDWGEQVVADLLRDARSMSPDGQLYAVDVAHEVGSAAAAGPGLTALLTASPHSEVRRAAAIALGGLRVDSAITALSDQQRQLVSRRLAPQSLEAAAIRRALTALGVRAEILPALTRSLRRAAIGLEWVWPADRLTDLLLELADHQQVVLDVYRFEQFRDGSVRAVGADNSMWHFDHDLSWPGAVSQSHAFHCLQASGLPTTDIVVSLNWIDRADG